MIRLSIKDTNTITPEVDKLMREINESLKPTNERIMDIIASIKTNLGYLHNEDMEKYIRYQLKTIEDMIMYPYFVQWDGVNENTSPNFYDTKGDEIKVQVTRHGDTITKLGNK